MNYSPESVERYARKLSVMIHFADELRTLGTDPKIQVGCVIFPFDCSRVLSIGYNGAPKGLPHGRPDIPLNTEDGSGMCHAELNALTKLDTQSAPPCILFTHYTPCSRCAAQIINAGAIKAVIHENPFPGYSWAGFDLLLNRVLLLHRVDIQTDTDTLKRWMDLR